MCAFKIKHAIYNCGSFTLSYFFHNQADSEKATKTTAKPTAPVLPATISPGGASLKESLKGTSFIHSQVNNNEDTI